MNSRIRKSSVERRKDIVAAVLKIIGKQGFTSLSAQTIADEVGITSGALFRHYASLQEIFEEVVQQAITTLETTFPDDSHPPLERLLELARNRVHLLGASPGLAWLLRSEQAYFTLPKTSVALLRAIAGRSREYLLKALREGASQGSVRNDIEPEILLVSVMGTIHALIGMPGIHKLTIAGQKVELGRVLAALEILVSPPVKAGTEHPE
jgi:AcrR family transcriptional regulator